MYIFDKLILQYGNSVIFLVFDILQSLFILNFMNYTLTCTFCQTNVKFKKRKKNEKKI